MPRDAASPFWSPDGRRIGLSTFRAGADGVDFWSLPWPDGEHVKPLRVFEAVLLKAQYPPSFSWMPGSRHVVLAIEGNLWVGDTETGRLRPITSSVEGEISEGNVSPDGKRIALSKVQDDHNVIQIPLDGSQPKLIMASSRNEHSLSLAITGNKSTYITDRSGCDEIWLRVNDVDFRPIVTKKDFPDVEGYGIANANISPDGNLVAFRVGGSNSGSKIYITSTEGGKPTRLFSGDNFEQISSWSSDSKYLAAEISEKGSNRLTVIRAGGQEPPRFILNTDDIRSWVNWSPDGKWIAYGSGQNIVMVSPDGKVKKRIPSPETAGREGYLLVWSKDGSTIYVASSIGKRARLHAVDITSGKSRKLAEYQDGITFSAIATYALFGSLTPDGKSFVTTAVDSKSDIWILEGFPKE